MNSRRKKGQSPEKSDSLFGTVSQMSSDMIFICQGGRVIHANRKCEELTGYSREELISGEFNMTDLIHPDCSGPERVDFIKHVKGTRTRPYECRLITKDGRELLGIHSSQRTDFNGKGAVVGIISDISVKRTSLAALKESEHKYWSLVETANDAIFIADVETGIIMEANRKAEELMGIPRKRIIGMHQSELHPEEDRDLYKSIFKNHIMMGKGHSYDIFIVNSTGEKIAVDISANITVIQGKKVIQGIFRDISDRKQTEKELRSQHDQLEELVQARTVELTAANKKLKIEVRTRQKIESQLLDFQKQLRLLTSQISLIEENEKRRIATELHDCIGQTLALSKIKLGLLSKSAPTEDIRRNIKEITQLVEQTIKETRTLTFELSPPILYELGLVQAVKWLSDQFRQKHGLDIDFIDDGREKPFDNNTRFFSFRQCGSFLSIL